MSDGVFPEVGGNDSGDQASSVDVRSAKAFTNQLYSNDSLTVCNGFINDVRIHNPPDRPDESLVFIRVGLLDGSRPLEGGGFEGVITNWDLIAGPTVKRFFEQMAHNGAAVSLNGVRAAMEIKNKRCEPKMYDGQPVLNTRGVLESVKFGWIDK